MMYVLWKSDTVLCIYFFFGPAPVALVLKWHKIILVHMKFHFG